jgi:hypothetical protein
MLSPWRRWSTTDGGDDCHSYIGPKRERHVSGMRATTRRIYYPLLSPLLLLNIYHLSDLLKLLMSGSSYSEVVRRIAGRRETSRFRRCYDPVGSVQNPCGLHTRCASSTQWMAGISRLVDRVGQDHGRLHGMELANQPPAGGAKPIRDSNPSMGCMGCTCAQVWPSVPQSSAVEHLCPSSLSSTQHSFLRTCHNTRRYHCDKETMTSKDIPASRSNCGLLRLRKNLGPAKEFAGCAPRNRRSAQTVPQTARPRIGAPAQAPARARVCLAAAPAGRPRLLAAGRPASARPCSPVSHARLRHTCGIDKSRALCGRRGRALIVNPVTSLAHHLPQPSRLGVEGRGLGVERRGLGNAGAGAHTHAGGDHGIRRREKPADAHETGDRSVRVLQLHISVAIWVHGDCANLKNGDTAP